MRRSRGGAPSLDVGPAGVELAVLDVSRAAAAHACARATRGEQLAFDVDDRHVVLAAGVVRRLDQRVDDVMRPAGQLRHDLVDGRRLDQIGQAVAAQQQGGVGLERNLVEIDELGIRLLVRLRADVAIHLVPPRVPHRVDFGDLVGVLALADRRVIARDFLDAVAAELVEPRVARHARSSRACSPTTATVSTHAIPVHSGREDATRRISLLAIVIASRTRSRGRAGLPLEPRPQHRQRHVGGLAAGRLAADAVDEDEEAAGRRRRGTDPR